MACTIGHLYDFNFLSQLNEVENSGLPSYDHPRNERFTTGIFHYSSVSDKVEYQLNKQKN